MIWGKAVLCSTAGCASTAAHSRALALLVVECLFKSCILGFL